MQLIVHVPLINSNLPGNSHFYLLEQLKIIRMHFSDVNAWLEELVGGSRKEDAALVRDENLPYYTTLLYECGYSFSLWPNLILVFCLIAVTLSIWVLSCGVDLASRCACCKNRYGANRWMSNFLVRLLYEVFFEIILCLMINLSFIDFESASQRAALSICFVLAVLTLAALVLISLNFCYRGPQVKSIYEARSLYHLWGWGYRPLNRDHPEVLKLREALEQDQILIDD